MSIEWVNGAIEEIRAWGRSKNVAVDVDEIRLLCDYASDYLDVGELSDFTPGTFEQLLLDIYPRKVIAPPESAAETVAAARTLVEFLLESGEIGTKMADRMRVKIDEIAPEMPAALADTSKFGMAKSIFGAMGADALEEGLPQMPAGDSSRLPGDSGARTPHRPASGDLATPSRRHDTGDEQCDCPVCAPLPAVRLAPAEQIARAVREVALLQDAHRLVAWMAEGGRTPTVRGRLRVKDAKLAVRELGLATPALAWELATFVGLTEAPRPLESLDDAELLELWAGTVSFLTGPPEASVTGSAELDRELYAVHDMLYRLQTPLAVLEIREYLDEVWSGDDPDGGETDLEDAVDALARCGTVERLDDIVRLTPHGLWGLRETYTRMGHTAPVAPDPAEGDAEALISGLLDGVPAEQAERDIASWLERRTPEQAAGELLEAVRGGTAVSRGVAVTIVDRIGPGAAPAMRPFLDDPELRPHVVHWLNSHGLGAPALTPEEVLWMSVDMLALALPGAEDDPEELAENLAAAGPPVHVIEEMWRVEHPDVAEVLDLLGRHLPDRELAKAARKAAFKARSRGIH
ncbi:hypothetical protein [Sphaerisporangium fuscum]|uniref:hypothetical protein n=1 Tax=Sphaerisporangium fuscum TaxID=2835868 RepID=UPI001BDC7B92|nr:hypothetical protein [Sphaerisporangium fuscum]